MKSNKSLIILSSIFLGIATIMFLLELYTNYECMRIIYANSQESNHTLGEAIGDAVTVGFTYILTVLAGIVTVGITIPVIPFSAVMLKREKNAPYAIVFLVVATVFIVVAIGTLFFVPMQSSGGSSSSSYYSSAQPQPSSYYLI